jgi:hypothetical protein
MMDNARRVDVYRSFVYAMECTGYESPTGSIMFTSTMMLAIEAARAAWSCPAVARQEREGESERTEIKR